MRHRVFAAATIFALLACSAAPAAAAAIWRTPHYYSANQIFGGHQQIFRFAPKTTPTPPPSPSPATDALTALEQQMVDLVNQERASRGLQPLAVDDRLVKIARLKSADMIANNYFAHTSPVYGSPFDMMKAAGITYRKAGENLAGAGGVAAAHSALMNSTGHRANILDPVYTRIGIGIIKGGPYGYMFTQEFIGL